MPQFKTIRKAFGPRTPGAHHELLQEGEVIEADKLPSDAYAPVEQGEASASPAAVRSAKRRAAAAEAASAAEE